VSDDTTRVRIGADFNAVCTHAEVARIDFDTDDRTLCLCVEYLPTRGCIVVDIFDEREPWLRDRVADFPAPQTLRGKEVPA
jgi:hypothetical protein